MKIIWPLLLATIYFCISLLTIKDYNISWDETIHFRRGQAYLHFFFTGLIDYRDLPVYQLQGTLGDPKKTPLPRRSFYQSEQNNARFFLEEDSGHPPLNGELAALTNFIFYQKLGILDDVSAHHLFNILSSSLLVFVVCYFAISTLNLFSAMISFLSLVTYPLFFSESHFNIKDPPEAAFYAATIWSYYMFSKRQKKNWLIVMGIFFGLALGTKFNILTLPLVLFFHSALKIKGHINSFYLKTQIKSGLLYLVPFTIGTAIFLVSWPYLWQDFPDNLWKIFTYYKDIGVGVSYQEKQYYLFGFNTFPLQWIIFTSPPWTLVLALIGLVTALNRLRLKQDITSLWLVWLLIPIARVTFPGTTIYGGIRQIMEFLPAMVLLAGLGANQLVEWVRIQKFSFKKSFNYKLVSQLTIISFFVWPIVVIVKMHPHQNVYFNQLIGGLKGAKEWNFPSWGNSFGNAYKDGWEWINKNAKPGAKLALIQGTPANVPAIFLRQDIDYKNANWSGINRQGEYLMELTFNDTGRSYNYAWEYLEKFLIPVYEKKVDGVTLLKIWKNDLANTKEDSQKIEVSYTLPFNMLKTNKEIRVSLPEKTDLSRLMISFELNSACDTPKNVYVETSIDSVNWIRETDWIPFPQVGNKDNLVGSLVNFYLAGKRAKVIKLVLDSTRSCLQNNTQIQLFVL